MAKRPDIAKRANDLLARAQQTKAPIDVEHVARVAGAVVAFEAYGEDLSGVLVKGEERVVIGVNSTHAKTRQRFTIAHECGHLALGHKGELFVDQTVMRRDDRSSKAIDFQEIDANAFAAELLMPEPLIAEAVMRRQARRPGMTPSQLVGELAAEFEVSTQAMEYRLTNLGMFMMQ